MLGSPDPPLLLNGEGRHHASTTTALRISARVLRKKEERQGSESEGGGPPTGNEEPPMALVRSAVQTGSLGTVESEKPRRTWEQWSTQDKTMFFEGLNEYGKNFDAIEGHFQSKSKKKTMLKTREQIRTFYYRTWHKISAHIVFPDHLKKSVRELYGLINYGELRKRLGGKLDEKNGAKLQELVFTGLTTIRVKGKTYRVKTPICRALKRLVTKLEGTKANSANSANNGHGQKTVIPSMPDHVTVDLKPLSENDFYQVHSNCFQNPHVQITVGLSQRVAGLIDFLDKKWASKSPHRNATEGQDLELWIQTKPGTVLNRPVLTSVEPLTHTSLSLSSIQEKIRPSTTSNPVMKSSEKTQEPEETQNGGTKVEEEANHPPMVTTAKSDDIKTEESPGTNDDHLVTQWNKTQGAKVTFGELFLMLGLAGNKNMELCYHFQESTQTTDNGIEHHQLKPRFAQVPTTSILARMAQNELARKQTKVLSSPGAKSGATIGPWRSPSGGQNQTNSPRTPKSSELHTNESALRLGQEEFRRPSAPAAKINSNQSSAQAFKQQLSMLLPKYSNRKGRTTTRKTNVVSRQLLANRPLQPKSNLISKDGVMKVRIVSDPTKDVLDETAMSLPPSLISTPLLNPVSLSPVVPNLPKAAPLSPEIPTISIPESSRPGSPTGSISSLFEGSLSDLASGSGSMNSGQNHTPTKSDHFLDSVLENSNSSMLQTPPRHRPTPPSSPSRAVHDSWLPELSLSSLLESPIKNGPHNGNPATINEDSIQSVGSEVDRQILLMMTESSVDFTNKFAKLASHVNND